MLALVLDDPTMAVARVQHENLAIADIIIGQRHRRDLGDIPGLAASIGEIGLLQPVVVTNANVLVAGERRIRAFQHLGRSCVPVRRLDIECVVRGEFDENEIRKAFTPSERVAIAAALQTTGGRGRPDNSQKIGNKVTAPEAARKAGFGNETTYRQAKTVLASGTPALVAAMDSGRVSISAAAAATKLDESDRARALASEDPNRSLRDAVIAMASTKPPPSANRNPLYKPDERYKAFAAIAGFCESISGKVETHGAEYISAGALDEAMRERERKTIIRCIENLNELLEAY